MGPSETPEQKAAREEKERKAKEWADFLQKTSISYAPTTVNPLAAQTVDRSQVQNVAAPTIANPANVSAAPIGATAVDTSKVGQVAAGPGVANVTPSVGSIANNAQVAQGMGSVQNALALQQQAAQGAAPSAAELMLKQQADQILAQQNAVMAGRGYDPAAARLAAQQGVALQQQAATQGAVLRADEMAKARDAFSSGALASSAQTAGVVGQDVANQLSGLTADQRAGVEQRAQNLQASGMNADNALKVALTEKQATDSAALASGELALRAAQGNQAAAVQVELARADSTLRANLANQGVDLDVLKTNAAAGNVAAIETLRAQLTAAGLNNDMISKYLTAIVSMRGQDKGIEQAKAGRPEEKSPDMLTTLLGAAGKLAPIVMAL
jgi:hypothetical protein